MLVILFSANIAKKHQVKLELDFPKFSFIFTKGIEEAKQHLSKAEIIVTYGEDLTETHIEQASELKWIMVISAGIDKMPFKAIKDRGILVTNARGIHKVPMAEYVISMLLQVYRQEKLLIQNEAISKWNKALKMQEISGNTMVVVGTGAIGQEVARLGQAFNMKTIGVSKNGGEVSYFNETHAVNRLDDVLPEADFIISVLPSTAETRGLFAAAQFKKMKDTAIFVNIGRGDVVNNKDLIESMRGNEIAHAILDVFEVEPLPEAHPFWRENNITVTPHLSGVSSHYISRALAIFTENLERYEADSKDYVNEVDVTKGY